MAKIRRPARTATLERIGRAYSQCARTYSHPAMARFDEPQDPLFARINTSVGFDRRLWREDIAGSRVHAAGLARAGVIEAEELTELERGLDAVAAELEAGDFEFLDTDEDIHMAVERR